MAVQISRPGYANRGMLVDSFILSITNPGIPTKGVLCAENPLFWGLPWIDLGKKPGSKLYINISKGLTNCYAKITFKMACIMYGVQKTGELQLKYKPLNKDALLKQKTDAKNYLSQYEFATSTYSNDSDWLELSTPDFDDLQIEEVKIEIFETFLIKR